MKASKLEQTLAGTIHMPGLIQLPRSVTLTFHSAYPGQVEVSIHCDNPPSAPKPIVAHSFLLIARQLFGGRKKRMDSSSLHISERRPDFDGPDWYWY
jgi:hypothetical protein